MVEYGPEKLTVAVQFRFSAKILIMHTVGFEPTPFNKIEF